MQLQTKAAKDTYIICHAGQYAYTVQHGNVSSHTWNTVIQGALGLLNAAKVPVFFYSGTHFAYPGGMTSLSWPVWLVKTERVGTWFEPIPSQY